MSIPTSAQLVIDGLVAFGTIAVAVLAIWGPGIRSILAPAKLKVMLHTPRGNPTTGKPNDGTGGDIRLMYFRLKVVNERPWLPAENCRALLKSLNRAVENDAPRALLLARAFHRRRYVLTHAIHVITEAGRLKLSHSV